jgi:hypothetical protein
LKYSLALPKTKHKKDIYELKCHVGKKALHLSPPPKLGPIKKFLLQVF